MCLRQIGTRPSFISILVQMWLRCHMNRLTDPRYRIMASKLGPRKWKRSATRFLVFVWFVLSQRLYHGPLTGYAKWRVAHASGMPGTFSLSSTSKETASWRSRYASRHVRHVRTVMHVGIEKSIQAFTAAEPPVKFHSDMISLTFNHAIPGKRCFGRGAHPA